MAQIDLSRYAPAIQDVGRERQVFEGEGDVNAYRAMANLGQGMAQIATQLHDKELDIFTDREAQTGLSKLETNIETEKVRAKANISDKNTVLTGDADNMVDSGKTYDQHMADYIDQQRQEINDTMVEPVSKVKYAGVSDRFSNRQKIDAVLDNSKIITKASIQSYDQNLSLKSNNVLYSDGSHIVQNLDTQFAALDAEDGMILNKAAGNTTYLDQTTKAKKSLIESGLNAAIREARSDPNAAPAFSSMIGLGLAFRTVGDLKKYVVQKQSEMNNGETPDPEVVNNIVGQLTGGKETEDSFVMTDNATIKPHEFNQMLTPQEKNSYLNQMLAISFKNEKEKDDGNSAHIADLIKEPLNVARWSNDPLRPSGWADEFVATMLSDSYADKNKPYKTVQHVYTAADNYVMGQAEKYLATGARSAYNNYIKTIDKVRAKYATDILDKVLDPDQMNEVKTTMGAVGEESSTHTQEKLKALQDKMNIKAVRDPMYFVQIDPVWGNLSKQAVQVSPDGKVSINPKAMAQLDSFTDHKLKTVGTAASQFETQNVLPPALMSKVATAMQLSSPEDQQKLFKQMNQTGPHIATQMVTQLMGEGKIKLEDASLMLNSKLGDPVQADAANAKIIALRNRYTSGPLKKTIEDMNTTGWFGGTQSAKDIQAEMDSQLKDNKTLNDYKEIARASGMSETAINTALMTKDIRLAAMERMSRTLPDQQSWGTTLSAKVKPYVDDTIQDLFGSRAQTLVGDNIKGIFAPNTVSDPEKVKARATGLADLIKQGIQSGQLKMDMGDYKGIPRFANYDKLEPLTKDRMTKELVDSVSFNGTDVTGKSKDLVAMFKDKDTGSYYRMKLQTGDGKSFVPTVNGVDSFAHANENQLYQQIFSKAIQPTKFGKGTPISKRK